MGYFQPENGVSNGHTKKELLEALGIANNAWGDYRHWSAIYSHRMACVRYLRDFVLWKLEEAED